VSVLTATKTKRGVRSSPLDVELVEHICARVMSGELITHILKDEGMPSVEAFYRWLQEDPELMKGYEQALAIQAHHFALEAMDIADSSGERDNMRRVELRQKARFFLAEKLDRKRYGDHRNVNVNVEGEIKHSIHELLTDGTENLPIIDVEADEVKPVEEESNATHEEGGSTEGTKGKPKGAASSSQDGD
jgi:hypothetical protein